jgi:hypothetical protein
MPYEKSNKEIQESKVKGFKMKGSPMKRNFGIGADSPMKETTTQTLEGMNFQPYAHKTLSADDIPSFRDMVTLEQQQAARKAWKEKRANRKQEKQDKIDKHFADKKFIKNAQEGKFTDQVETVDTEEGQKNTTPITPQDINIVTDGEVTGSTSTSSIPNLGDYEAGSVDNPEEEKGIKNKSLNINTSNNLW